MTQGCGSVRGECERGWPAMRPTGNIHRGIMAGKLKGAMPAQTPRGTLYEYVSMPFDTFSSVSPIRWLAAPHVVSTTSRPLKRRQDENERRRQRQHLNTSPRASASVLPCSRVMMAASSSWCSRMRAWYLRQGVMNLQR
jgi:hypothetical protein